MTTAPLRTTFLIADISGYTGYLAEVELEHAQDILSDLISTVVKTLRPGYRLAKLEGDAAFTYASEDAIDGTQLLDTIERCYLAFRRRRRDIRQATTCPCNACSRIPDLDLKFVVHHGTALHQRIAGRSELLGSDVILVHRLLKNEVVERLGIPAYALFSQACLDAAGLDPAALGMQAHTETYDRIGTVPLWAHDLEARWREEEARSVLVVDPATAILDLSIDTTAPPAVAWRFLTTPGQRMSWQPWVTAVAIEGAEGGRRGSGSENHCRHGEDAVIEQILDWRPFDHVTDRTVIVTPEGPVRTLHTIELEELETGTRIHLRFGPGQTKREREALSRIGPAYGSALASRLPELAAQLEAAAAAAAVDADLDVLPTRP